jgi:hypothetical protein
VCVRPVGPRCKTTSVCFIFLIQRYAALVRIPEKKDQAFNNGVSDCLQQVPHRTPLSQNEEKSGNVPAPTASASESAFCVDGSFSPRMKILSPSPSDLFTPFLNCSCLLAQLHPGPLLPRLSPASTPSSLHLPSAPCASQAPAGLLPRLPAGYEDSGADSGPFLGDFGAKGWGRETGSCSRFRPRPLTSASFSSPAVKRGGSAGRSRSGHLLLPHREARLRRGGSRSGRRPSPSPPHSPRLVSFPGLLNPRLVRGSGGGLWRIRARSSGAFLLLLRLPPHAGVNCCEAMRDEKRITAAALPPLRDGIICIPVFFADA